MKVTTYCIPACYRWVIGFETALIHQEKNIDFILFCWITTEPHAKPLLYSAPLNLFFCYQLTLLCLSSLWIWSSSYFTAGKFYFLLFSSDFRVAFSEAWILKTESVTCPAVIVTVIILLWLFIITQFHVMMSESGSLVMFYELFSINHDDRHTFRRDCVSVVADSQ